MKRILNTETDAELFCRHSFDPTIRLLGQRPTIFVTPSALNLMWHIVDAADKEVGWLGTCRRRGDDYLIEEVFLFEQRVNESTTIITEEGLGKFGHELLTTRDDGMEVWNNIRFWGHSHVYFGTDASRQDEEQLDAFRSCGHPFFLRGIANKRGEFRFTLDLLDRGIRIYDVPWRVLDTVDFSVRSRIEREIAEKVTLIPRKKHVRRYGTSRIVRIEDDVTEDDRSASAFVVHSGIGSDGDEGVSHD